MACENLRQPGPSIVVYFDRLSDSNPTLFSMTLLELGANLWQAQIVNRRTNLVVHLTGIVTTEREAMSEGKTWMAPYLLGQATLP